MSHRANDGRREDSRWRSSIRLMVLLLAVLVAPLMAQPLDPVIKPGHAEAIRAIAPVMARIDGAGQQLERMGYHPPNSDIWRTMPALRKLEAVYIAAENAAPGTGGEKMLALLSRELAQQYGQAQLPAPVQKLAGSPAAAEDRPPKFQVKPRYTPRPIPDTAANGAYQALTKYAEGAKLGGPSAILQDYLGMPSEAANDVLATSASMSEAFKRAISWVPEQQRGPRLAKLVSDIDALYGEAARADVPLNRFRVPTTRLVPEAAPGPLVLPPPELRPVRAGSAAPVSYPKFVEAHYSRAGSAAFAEMISVAEGFGGVVFGADVKADAGLGRPAAVRWVPGKDRSQGTLEFRLNGGATAIYSPVRYEDALAAMQMVSGTGGVPWHPGEGIGLVGLDVEHPARFTQCSADCRMDETRRWNVILHPALANTELGWAAIMADSLPTDPAYIRKLAALGGIARPDAQRLEAWCDRVTGNYKFIDTAVRIGADAGNRIRVTPSGGGAANGTLFLGLKAFEDSVDRIHDFEQEFPRIAPALMKAAPYYARLNRYAPVLALMRWAKASRASIEVSGGTQRPVETPGSVAITEAGVLPLPGFTDPDAAAAENLQYLDAQAAKLIGQLPATAAEKFTLRRVLAGRIAEYRREAREKELNTLEIGIARLDRQVTEKASPQAAEEFQDLLSALDEAREDILDALGTERFDSGITGFEKTQQKMEAWIAAHAPEVADARKQLEHRWMESVRLESGLAFRRKELEGRLPSEEDCRRAAVASLVGDAKDDYEKYTAEAAAAGARADKIDDGITRLQTQLRETARQGEEAESLRRQIAAEEAKLDDLEAAAESATEKAGEVMKKAFPQIKCIESLLSRLIERDDLWAW